MSVRVWPLVLRHVFADVPGSRVDGRRLSGVSCHAQKLVLLVLAEHARDDGAGAYPSLATMARDAQLSRAQVRRTLDVLRDAEYVEQVAAPRQHRPAEYRVCLDRLAQGSRGATSDDAQGARGATSDEIQGSRKNAQRSRQARPESLIEPSLEPRARNNQKANDRDERYDEAERILADRRERERRA